LLKLQYSGSTPACLPRPHAPWIPQADIAWIRQRTNAVNKVHIATISPGSDLAIEEPRNGSLSRPYPADEPLPTLLIWVDTDDGVGYTPSPESLELTATSDRDGYDATRSLCPLHVDRLWCVELLEWVNRGPCCIVRLDLEKEAVRKYDGVSEQRRKSIEVGAVGTGPETNTHAFSTAATRPCLARAWFERPGHLSRLGGASQTAAGYRLALVGSFNVEPGVGFHPLPFHGYFPFTERNPSCTRQRALHLLAPAFHAVWCSGHGNGASRASGNCT